MDLILEQLAEVVSYDSATIMWRIEGVLRIIACRGFRDPTTRAGHALRPPRERADRAADERGRARSCCEDVLTEPTFYTDPGDCTRAWIGVPLIVRDQMHRRADAGQVRGRLLRRRGRADGDGLRQPGGHRPGERPPLRPQPRSGGAGRAQPAGPRTARLHLADAVQHGAERRSRRGHVRGQARPRPRCRSAACRRRRTPRSRTCGR